MEAISQFQPPIAIRPCLLRYLGTSHNQWHRTMLMLEDIVLNKQTSIQLQQQQQLQQQKQIVATSTKSSSMKSNKRSYSAANLDDLSSETDTNQNSVLTVEFLQNEAMDGLSNLYETLYEEDMWSGLWQRKAKFPETIMGIAYEQQGHFEQAQVKF